MERRSQKNQKSMPLQSVNPGTSIEEIVMNPQNRQEDSIKLLTIFPEELWTLILANLDTSTDFQNIGSSSPLFAQLLQSLRTQVLFPSVFKVMFNKRKEDCHSIISKLRQVCPSWKRGVDQTLQHLDSSFNFKTDTKFSVPSNGPIHRNLSPVFRSVDRIAAFEERFSGHKGNNPFVTRRLFLQIRDQFDLWWDGLEEMLKNYGNHIWYLDIDVDFKYSSEQQLNFYKSLVRMMSSLPNLKALRVNIAPCQGFNLGDLDKLKLYLQEVSVPNLPKLEFVRFNKVSPVLWEAILGKNQQIKSVETGYWDEETTKQAALNLVPNLQNFSTYANSLTELETIIPGKLNIPLVKLNLILTDLRTSYLDWRLPFQILKERFPATLQELKIAMPSQWHVRGDETLNLPSLKKLSVYLKICQNIDFILPMKNHLKELSITVGDRDYNIGWYPEDTVIKIYEHKNDLTGSNLWTLMPKLQRLSLQGKCCTRTQWIINNEDA